MEKNIIGSINNKTIKEKFLLALENQKINNFKIAEKLYKEILKMNPGHFQTIGLLGSLSLQTKNLEQAKQLFDQNILLK